MNIITIRGSNIKKAQCSLLVLAISWIAREKLDPTSLQVKCSSSSPQTNRFSNVQNNLEGNNLMWTSRPQNDIAPAHAFSRKPRLLDNSEKPTDTNDISRFSLKDQNLTMIIPHANDIRVNEDLYANLEKRANNEGHQKHSRELVRSFMGQQNSSAKNVTSGLKYLPNKIFFDPMHRFTEDEEVIRHYEGVINEDIKRIDKKPKSATSNQTIKLNSADYHGVLKKKETVRVNTGTEKIQRIETRNKLGNSSHIYTRNNGSSHLLSKTTAGEKRSFDEISSASSLNNLAPPSSSSTPSPLRGPHQLLDPYFKASSSSAVLTTSTSRPLNVVSKLKKGFNSTRPDSSTQALIALESGTTNHNSECALVLKRTYVIKPEKRDNDEWGENFVFTDIDEKKKQGSLKTTSNVCVRHVDVNRAIAEAKHKIKFERPNDLNSLEIAVSSIATLAELILSTSQLLVKKFDLSHDEVLNALPMIDMSSTTLYWHHLCPRFVRPMHCSRTRYRTHTAHCNNLKHPAWGASKTPYSRYMPPDYADSLQEPRKSRSNEPLPSARLITSIVHRDYDVPTNDLSILFMSWGQLLDHDMTRAALGEAPNCCPQYLKGLCMPIPVPEDDPFYSKFNVRCLKFDRSPAAIRPKCLLGPRAQINEVTSPIDASFVYGSTRSLADRLRKFSDGKMRVWNYFSDLKLKPLLPPKEEKPDEECFARPKGLFCFLAGDVRVNEQTHLTVLHTLYVREHNRMAKIIGSLNLDWDDDKIYHEVRHIQAAGVQHVLVKEFLPLLLGHKHLKEYGIQSKYEGHWKGYDPTVTTSTGTAFAAAAFRYGHSMIQGMVRRYDKFHKFIKGELLRHLFKRPFLIYEPGVMDELISGLINTPSQTTDPFVTEDVSGHLFQPPKAPFGHDLPAINIQRGRDQGVPGYNDWREWCGLPRAKSFSDLELHLTNRTAHLYSRIYKHVDDIDLWSAGVSERKLPGTQVGPTFSCIISRQFANTKRGDRFWYENLDQPSSFTPEQLKEIKKITLAKILCTNADDLPTIQTWALRLPHPIYNARVPCESLPSINLEFWDSTKIG